MHKKITTSFQHRLHKKNYHSWIFENFIKVSPKPNYTYLFYFQTNINNIRSSYIFCVDFPHKLGLQIAGACTMFMKCKNEKWRTLWFSAKCTKFISRILNKWPVGIRQWIYIFCVYFILLIHIVDFGTWKYLHYSMLRVKMIPDTRMHHQDYMRVLSRVF